MEHTQYPYAATAGSSSERSRRKALLLLAALVVIPAAIILFLVVTRSPESLKAGDRIDSFVVRDMRGAEQTLNGRKGMWLIVSASCPICRHELEEMENSGEDVSRVTVVSLSPMTDTRELMQPFPRMRQRTVVDARGQLERTYGKFRFPTGFIVDGDGSIVQKWRGVRPAEVVRGDAAQ